MRFLIIVRHAEAMPAALGAADFDRHVSPRGREQCAQVRAWAADPSALGAYGPAVALVSSAVRTCETFDLAFNGTPLVSASVTSEKIYNGRHVVAADDLLGVMQAMDPMTSSLLVVAHNPTVTELLDYLGVARPASAHDGVAVGSVYVVRIASDTVIDRGPYSLVASYVPA